MRSRAAGAAGAGVPGALSGETARWGGGCSGARALYGSWGTSHEGTREDFDSVCFKLFDEFVCMFLAFPVFFS